MNNRLNITMALMAALILVLGTAAPALADDGQHRHGASGDHGHHGMMQGHGKASGQCPKEDCPHGDGMERKHMHGHMEEMRHKMKEIRETDDPAERRRLLEEHMESMRQGMQGMMGRGMGAMKEGMEGMLDIMEQMIEHMRMQMQQQEMDEATENGHSHEH